MRDRWDSPKRLLEREQPYGRDLVMIEPTQYEQCETLRPRIHHLDQGPDAIVRLQTAVSLLVHAETVLGRESGAQYRAVTLKGDLHLPELRAEISFEDGEDQNGHGRTHGGGANGHGRANGIGYRAGDSPWAIATIVPHLFTLPIPLQYFAPPAREESDVWALTRELSHDPPWVEHYAGQLQEVPFTFHHHVRIDTTFDLAFAHRESMNGGGAQVEVSGELRFDRSIRVRLLFRDPEQSMAMPSELDGDQAEVVVAGTRVPILRQTVSGLAGRHSRMVVRVVDDQDRVICAAQSLAGPAGRAA